MTFIIWRVAPARSDAQAGFDVEAPYFAFVRGVWCSWSRWRTAFAYAARRRAARVRPLCIYLPHHAGQEDDLLGPARSASNAESFIDLVNGHRHSPVQRRPGAAGPDAGTNGHAFLRRWARIRQPCPRRTGAGC
jgi:hypothetical protein